MTLLAALIDAGLTLRADDNRLIVTPAALLTEDLRSLIRQHKTELLDSVARGLAADRPYRLTPVQGDRCHAGGWDDAEMATFTARQALMLGAGHGSTDAEDLAERLTLRDRDADDRRACIECRHYHRARCGNREAAGLHSQEVGRGLAALLQRCPGFVLKEQEKYK
ncbi:MAG: hypothetical protein H0W40_10725 [Methylibium sp.]|uniref:hypothetical protein n=1 Tax=Methylibium sp. TaxID=2067992 RepID=UPI0017A6D1FF|nr:hypothetical protein [Methylibium sp.]MBA3597833.1 hypothetical protein [Methylibium sp.]